MTKCKANTNQYSKQDLIEELGETKVALWRTSQPLNNSKQEFSLRSHFTH